MEYYFSGTEKCEMEIEIVAFVIYGSVKSAAPLDQQLYIYNVQILVSSSSVPYSLTECIGKANTALSLIMFCLKAC